MKSWALTDIIFVVFLFIFSVGIVVAVNDPSKIVFSGYSSVIDVNASNEYEYTLSVNSTYENLTSISVNLSAIGRDELVSLADEMSNGEYLLNVTMNLNISSGTVPNLLIR